MSKLLPDDKLFPSQSFKAPAPAVDTVQKFEQILADHRDGWLQIPLHQRDANAWDFAKRQRYIARLRNAENGSHPPGSFATYQCVQPGQDTSPTFLNDGFQRLMTLADLQADPLRYDMDTDDVRALLQVPIAMQHRHYPNHDAAMADFQLINNGTRLTPHELCQGFIKYMPDYEPRWRVFLEDVELAMGKSATRLCTGRSQRREVEHKQRRHTLALFFRFLIEEKRHCHYPDVSAKDVQEYVDKRGVVELRLRDALLDKGYEEARSSLKKFRIFMDAETAMLEKCIHSTLGPGIGLNPVTHRWLLDLAVWRRNNGMQREPHAVFVEKLLARTRGQAQWVQEAEDGKRVSVTLNYCHLGLLPKLAELAGMPEFCRPQRRRRGPPLLPGYDNSHFEPFVTNGDGPTFPEPAPQNRSRGAQPVAHQEQS